MVPVKPRKANAMRGQAAREVQSNSALRGSLTSVQTTTNSETGPTWCRFPLSCPPPSLPFLPFLPGMQPGAPLPDCTAEADRRRVETACSWRISIASPGHEYAAVLRLLIDGIAQRNGCADIIRRLIGRRRIVVGLCNEERSFAPIRRWRRHDRRHIRRSRKRNNRCECGYIGACFCGQRAACRQMLVIAAGTGIVGGKHGRDIAIAIHISRRYAVPARMLSRGS